MFTAIDTRHCHAVEQEVRAIHAVLFPQADAQLVPRAFGWATICFTGRYPGYQAIDAAYHDFEHTLQGTLCLARLLQGYFQAEAVPALTPKMFELALLAILLHDTGYLKTTDDREGTGAKYTLIHVNRSAEFAAHLLGEKQYGPGDIRAVQSMIRCTGVNADLTTIPFANELERMAGFALATADLLGQMAADDYVDKLPILFEEFTESARHNDGKMTGAGSFRSARDLMEKTPLFWEKYVVPKIARDFHNLHQYLNRPYPNGANDYLKRIEANLERLGRQLAAS